MAFIQGLSRYSLARKRSIIFLKKLCDLVAVLPNHRTFRASPNPLGVQPMHRTSQGMSGLQRVKA